MGVNIEINGLKASGNSKVLNNMNVSGNSKVNIGVSNSKLTDRSKMLNDLKVSDSTLEVQVSGLKLDKDAEFMNKKSFEGETIRSERTVGSDKKGEKEEKSGMIARMMAGFRKQSEKPEVTTSKKTQEPSGHAKFEAIISENGKLKGVAVISGTDKTAEEEQRDESKDKGMEIEE